MATASQKIMLMRFLDVIRGVRTAAPTKLLPVMKMPLDVFRREWMGKGGVCRVLFVSGHSIFLGSEQSV
jgi:hypothetical protein